MTLHLTEITRPYYTSCSRCDKFRVTFLGGIGHDLRCWGWHTALFNVAFRIKAALGIIEPDREDWGHEGACVGRFG